jgi:wobble nucleotide-excising tRNase
MLMLMAKAGIQVFVATHNYFVLKQMHLSARRDNVSTNCYSLSREKGKSIKFKMYDLKNEFPENPISDEAIRMSDEEVKLDLGL